MLHIIKAQNPTMNLRGLLTPVNIGQMSQVDSLNLINNVGISNLNQQLAERLGRFVPRNASLSNFENVASGIPIEILQNATIEQALDCLLHCDLQNFDSNRINCLVNNVS